jgi:hypothetical protein
MVPPIVGKTNLEFGERLQRHPPDPIGVVTGKLRRRLHGQPALARATRAGEGDETAASAADRLHQLGQLVLAADERRRLQRQARGPAAAQLRELVP